jgi:hypothetical protein
MNLKNGRRAERVCACCVFVLYQSRMHDVHSVIAFQYVMHVCVCAVVRKEIAIFTEEIYAAGYISKRLPCHGIAENIHHVVYR